MRERIQTMLLESMQTRSPPQPRTRKRARADTSASVDAALLEWDDGAPAPADAAQPKDPRRIRVGYKRSVFGGEMVRAIDMDGDGNCLFRALAHQLDGGTSTSSEELHDYVRATISDYAAEHGATLRTEFGAYLADVSWEHALSYLRHDGAWDSGSVDVLVAPIAARCFGRIVRVFQRTTPTQEYWPVDEPVGEPLLLFRSVDHYYSVRRDT